MAKQCVINVDLVDVWAERGRKGFLRTLAWGDAVSVVDQSSKHLEIALPVFHELSDGSILPEKTSGFIEPAKSSGLKAADVVIPRAQNKVLKINFVDVQQGDGSVIETPAGKVILIDGGDNQLFARYLAGRFRGTTEDRPLAVDCILVTHGDADHFVGLPQILKSETNREKRKRLFIQPKRIYHNGIVKGPSKRKNGKAVPDSEMLGATRKVDGRTFLTGLKENLLTVDDDDMNQPFRLWKETLKTYNKRSKLSFRRLQFGDDDAFDFVADEGIKVQVLGPLVVEAGGKPALPFLGNPPKGPRIGHESLDIGEEGFRGLSASHTINGHSVVFRLAYGGFSYLFTGDLNDESGRFLAREDNVGNINLKSEVFKVPHHGSADFSGAFLQAVQPIVSIVSSGDESAKKEYIHPRATIVGALGKWSRVPEPLVFVTELVAFFNLEGCRNWPIRRRPRNAAAFSPSAAPRSAWSTRVPTAAAFSFSPTAATSR